MSLLIGKKNKIKINVSELIREQDGVVYWKQANDHVLCEKNPDVHNIECKLHTIISNVKPFDH